MVKLSATNYKTGESVVLGKYSNYKYAAQALLEEVVWDEDDIPGHWHFDISVDDGRTAYEELEDFMNKPEGIDWTEQDEAKFQRLVNNFMNELIDDENDKDEDYDDFEDDVDETNYDPYMGCDYFE